MEGDRGGGKGREKRLEGDRGGGKEGKGKAGKEKEIGVRIERKSNRTRGSEGERCYTTACMEKSSLKDWKVFTSDWRYSSLRLFICFLFFLVF